MKSITLICLSLIVAVSLSFADNHTSREPNKREFYTLRDNYIELRYIINEMKFRFDNHLNQKDQVIARLEEKIKELENELFYTTESLRCLELEVWDMTPSKSTMESSADDVSAIRNFNLTQ